MYFDPYYLSYKAIKSGYRPLYCFIRRNLNDDMSNVYFKRISKFIKQKKLKIKMLLVILILKIIYLKLKIVMIQEFSKVF